MTDYRVSRVGTDSSGRPIFMTNFMRLWWADVCAELGFTPVITQGAFMKRAGGGADASEGYHDVAGTLDLRIYDRTDREIAKMIRVLRRFGAAAWVRNKEHGGFDDPHIHLVLGSDYPLSAGAQSQWRDYLNGRDGLSGDRPDYHWRPSPLVLEPPKKETLDVDEQKLRQIIAEVVDERLDRILGTPVNASPETDNAFTGMNIRSLLKKIAVKVGAV